MFLAQVYAENPFTHQRRRNKEAWGGIQTNGFPRCRRQQNAHVEFHRRLWVLTVDWSRSLQTSHVWWIQKRQQNALQQMVHQDFEHKWHFQPSSRIQLQTCCITIARLLSQNERKLEYWIIYFIWFFNMASKNSARLQELHPMTQDMNLSGWKNYDSTRLIQPIHFAKRIVHNNIRKHDGHIYLIFSIAKHNGCIHLWLHAYHLYPWIHAASNLPRWSVLKTFQLQWIRTFQGTSRGLSPRFDSFSFPYHPWDDCIFTYMNGWYLWDQCR